MIEPLFGKFAAHVNAPGPAIPIVLIACGAASAATASLAGTFGQTTTLRVKLLHEKTNAASQFRASQGRVEIWIRMSREWWLSRTGTQVYVWYTGSAEGRLSQAILIQISIRPDP